MTELSRGEQLRKNDFEELRSGQLENRKIMKKISGWEPEESE